MHRLLYKSNMASQTFSGLGFFPSPCVSFKGSHWRSPRMLLQAPVALVTVLSRAIPLRPQIAEGPRDFSYKAFLCYSTLRDKNAELTLFFEPSLPSDNETKPGDASSADNGEEGLLSVIIPTHNRLPILTKCLKALEEQEDYELGGIREYEVVVVDDGSTDGTLEYLEPLRERHDSIGESKLTLHTEASNFSNIRITNKEATWEPSRVFPHVKIIRQRHGGATRARNLGVRQAKGAVIVFIDSDLVVTKDFLRSHGAALLEARAKYRDDCTFTYGRVINTANFENPKSEKFKLTDNSAAFFATGNVAISRRLLLKTGNLLKAGHEGPFDADFSGYGWEDLELGVRLKQVGARIKHVPSAVGYHWHPAFSLDQIPKLINQERQRGQNGVRFFLKHPGLNVRLMTQLTPMHEGFWFLLTLGGLLTEKALFPVLGMLVAAGSPGLAAALLSPTLNWHTVQATKEEVKRLKRQGKFVKRKL